MEVFSWKQSLKQTMLTCSFFFVNLRTDIVFFLFGSGKSDQNRTQALFFIWTFSLWLDFPVKCDFFFFFFLFFLKKQSCGVRGFVTQGSKVLICLPRKKWLSRVCQVEKSNRIKEFNVPPGFNYAFSSKEKLFFSLYASWALVSVESKGAKHRQRALPVIFRLTLLCSDHFCRHCFQNGCNSRQKSKIIKEGKLLLKKQQLTDVTSSTPGSLTTQSDSLSPFNFLLFFFQVMEPSVSRTTPATVTRRLTTPLSSPACPSNTRTRCCR